MVRVFRKQEAGNRSLNIPALVETGKKLEGGNFNKLTITQGEHSATSTVFFYASSAKKEWGVALKRNRKVS